jgi:glutathione S-transferase
LIIDRLVAKGASDPDASLSPRDRAVSLAVRRMLKEHTYWIVVAIRYTVDENWLVYRRVIASALAPGAPEEQWAPVVDGLRELILAQAHAHGMGRHQGEEIRRLCRADVQALAELLGDKPFFMGEEPTTVDATAYAYIGNLLQAPFDTGLGDDDPAVQNLRGHCDRITERYFSDNVR